MSKPNRWQYGPTHAVPHSSWVTLSATQSDYLTFYQNADTTKLGRCELLVLQNNTGSDVYVKLDSGAAITPDATVGWYDLIVPSGETVSLLVSVQTVSLYVPTGGSALNISGTSKNFSVFAWGVQS